MIAVVLLAWLGWLIVALILLAWLAFDCCFDFAANLGRSTLLCFLISARAKCQEAQKCYRAFRQVHSCSCPQLFCGQGQLLGHNSAAGTWLLYRHGRGRSQILGDLCLTLHLVDPLHAESIYVAQRTPPHVCAVFNLFQSGTFCTPQSPISRPAPSAVIPQNLTRKHMQDNNAALNQPELNCEACQRLGLITRNLPSFNHTSKPRAGPFSYLCLLSSLHT